MLASGNIVQMFILSWPMQPDWFNNVNQFVQASETGKEFISNTFLESTKTFSYQKPKAITIKKENCGMVLSSEQLAAVAKDEYKGPLKAIWQ